MGQPPWLTVKHRIISRIGAKKCNFSPTETINWSGTKGASKELWISLYPTQALFAPLNGTGTDFSSWLKHAVPQHYNAICLSGSMKLNLLSKSHFLLMLLHWLFSGLEFVVEKWELQMLSTSLYQAVTNQDPTGRTQEEGNYLLSDSFWATGGKTPWLVGLPVGAIYNPSGLWWHWNASLRLFLMEIFSSMSMSWPGRFTLPEHLDIASDLDSNKQIRGCPSQSL